MREWGGDDVNQVLMDETLKKLKSFKLTNLIVCILKSSAAKKLSVIQLFKR